MNNINNILISKEYICDLVEKYSISHLKIDISNNSMNKFYIKAFLHKSFSNVYNYNDIEDHTCFIYLEKYILDNNERLEFFGDAVIYTIISEYLYNNYPDNSEGNLTPFRQKLIKKEQLSYLARELNFHKYLLIDNHLERTNIRNNNNNLLENVFESFIGALYQDQGFEITKDFIIGVYTKLVDFNKLEVLDDNYKTQMIMLYHKYNWNNPEYTLIDGNKNNFYSTVNVKKEKINSQQHNLVVKLHKQTVKNVLGHLKSINKLDTYSSMIKNDYYYIGFGNGNLRKNSEQDACKNCIADLKFF
jgi:ribonuclease-3